MYIPDMVGLFNEAAKLSPNDVVVHIVLGVLYNLSREYDKAIEAFQTALKLKPRDYSLWNKLGATQANSVQSADVNMTPAYTTLTPYSADGHIELIPEMALNFPWRPTQKENATWEVMDEFKTRFPELNLEEQGS
ncbi:hypothetical protein ACS0TY_011427 [Phlomoides rotata]